MDNGDRAAERLQMATEGARRPQTKELEYKCCIEGHGQVVVMATSPSDLLDKLEQTHGVGGPGTEHKIAFEVPKQHRLGGSEIRGNVDLWEAFQD